MTESLTVLATQVLQNPVVMGLVALGLNQAAYRTGLWDPRPSPDGKYRTYKSTWGFGTDGGFHLDLGTREWVETDPEQVAADNATMIGAFIIAASTAYAAKAPTILGVK
jgi:hypothetical protein